MNECPDVFGWISIMFGKGIRVFSCLPSGIDDIENCFDKLEIKLLPLSYARMENVLMKLFNEPELMKSWRNNLKGIRWEDKNENILF